MNKADVTLRVRPEGSPERRLVTQIYRQALKRAGYDVRRAPRAVFGSTISYDELKEDKLAGYPEYMSTILFYRFEVPIEDIPPRSVVAYRQLERKLEGEDLVAFPPAPYGIANTVGLLRKDAERLGVRTISDLKGKAEKLTVGAPTYCHISAECIGGIEERYDTAFLGVGYEQAETPELSWYRGEPDYRYELLEDGEFDASIFYNTDGRLATESDRFVALEDDKHVFPASNFVWITSQDVLEEAGPDYEKAIMRAQKGLTLPVMRRLNARMESGKPPAAVAAEYLKSIRYPG